MFFCFVLFSLIPVVALLSALERPVECSLLCPIMLKMSWYLLNVPNGENHFASQNAECSRFYLLYNWKTRDCSNITEIKWKNSMRISFIRNSTMFPYFVFTFRFCKGVFLYLNFFFIKTCYLSRL